MPVPTAVTSQRPSDCQLTYVIIEHELSVMCSFDIGVLKPQVSEERHFKFIDINKSISGIGSSHFLLMFCSEELRFQF
jgi:hypothetical protein